MINELVVTKEELQGFPYKSNHYPCDESSKNCSSTEIVKNGKRYPSLAEHCYAGITTGTFG